MAIVVNTTDPGALLKTVRQHIKDGKIDTWIVDPDGDFTHAAPQWNLEAWLRPSVELDRIVFKILAPKSKKMSSQVYAFYHSRFIEMLLRHFDEKFSDAKATAMPAHGDIVSGV